MSRGIGLIALIASALVALSACGSAGSHPATQGATIGSAGTVVPLQRLQLPATSAGCRGVSRLGGGAERIPATVSDREGQVVVLVNVCIEAKGPYPFIVDTGASSTAVDVGLANRLGLEAVGKPEKLAGPNCVTDGQEHRVVSWSIAGLPLQPQTLTAVKIPDLGGPGEPVGVIGSDVWNRFGQLRVDYRHRDLVVPGRERPVPIRTMLITEPKKSPLPTSIISGPAQLVAPMTVLTSRSLVHLAIAVAFGSQDPHEFIPDTGAAISLVRSGLATAAGLKRQGQRATLSTLCSVVVSPEVATGRWSIAGRAPSPRSLAGNELQPQPAAALNLTGLNGSLGSDQMSRFGSVIFDYAGGRILFGAH